MPGKNTIEIIDNPTLVAVDDGNVSVNVLEEIVTVEIGTTGPQGPKGDKGDNGEVLYVDLSYVHNQVSPSSTWTITHGLHFIPSITVVDTAGSVVEGDYSYPDQNTVVASFSSPFAGKAYLS